MKRRPFLIPIATIVAASGLLWGIATPVYAQQPAPPDPNNVTQASEAQGGISVAFNQVPLRAALEQLLNAAHVDYSISPNLPTSVYVTFKCTDLPFVTILQMMLKSADTDGMQVAYRVQNGTYIIEAQPVLPPKQSVTTSVLGLYRVPLIYVSSDKVVKQARNFFPPGIVNITAPDEHTLLVQTTPDQMGNIKQFVHMMDIESIDLLIRANIVYVSPQGKRRVLQSMVLRTLQDQEATSEQQSSGALPQQLTRFQMRVRPILRKDNSFDVANQWDISLPLSTLGVTKGNVRLEKRLTTTSHITPREVAEVGEIAGDQWGGAGKIVLELSADFAKGVKSAK